MTSRLEGAPWVGEVHCNSLLVNKENSGDQSQVAACRFGTNGKPTSNHPIRLLTEIFWSSAVAEQRVPMSASTHKVKCY
jgi:hypothetical protein